MDTFMNSICKPGPSVLWLEGVADEVLAMPAARSGGLRPEPIFVVSALRAPAAIANSTEEK